MRGVGGQEENASAEPAVSGRSARNWHAAWPASPSSRRPHA